MNQTEIEAIACEYAESVHPKSEGKGWEIPTDNQFEVWRRVVEYDVETLFEPFLRWLSDRYEIVNKNHVRDLYRLYNEMLERGNLAIGYTDRYDANKVLLEKLFPQTLKTE